MKYKVGDRVRIKSIDWYNENKDEYGYVRCIDFLFTPEHSKYCGCEFTISHITEFRIPSYVMENNGHEWTDEMIEGLVEKETTSEPKFKVGDKITNGKVTLTILTLSSDRYVVEDNFGECGTIYFNYQDGWKIVEEETKPKYEDEVNGEYYSTPKYLVRPSGYQFVDENGNVINATKIVLEKKKKEYPKTFLECCDVLNIGNLIERGVKGYKAELFDTLQKLYICRDAYWKIAGEKMGLGKPWKPDWTDLDQLKYCIWVDVGEFITMTNVRGQHILAFPTEEMRDAFKENFDPDIEICKELL